MPAYCLLDNLEITDPGKLEQYKRDVGTVVRAYGGRYVVLGGKAAPVEGDWKLTFPVMIEFPSFEDAQRWYDSEEYRELKALRLSAGRFNAVLIEGLDSAPALMSEGRSAP